MPYTKYAWVNNVSKVDAEHMNDHEDAIELAVSTAEAALLEAGQPGPPGPAGPQGIQGAKGDQGAGLEIVGTVPTSSALPATPLSVDDARMALDTGHIWYWDETKVPPRWEDGGSVQGAPGPQGPQGPTGSQGPQGTAGMAGATGSQGPAGPGVPVGGAINHVLSKKTAADYDTQWVAQTGGAGGATDLSYEGTHVPASTHEDGDIVVANGIAYIAHRATTQNPDPTAWGAIGYPPTTRQGELAYAQAINPVALGAGNTIDSSAAVVCTAPAVTLDGATPIIVEIFTQGLVNPASGSPGQIVMANIFDGSTDLGRVAVLVSPAIGTGAAGAHGAMRLTPSAGTHVYSFRAWGNPAGGSVNAGVGGPGGPAPAFIRVSLASPQIVVTPGHLVPVSYATTLPSAPVDGQEAILVDSLTAPTYQWRFRWNAGSANADKWEFIGGAEWRDYVATVVTVNPGNTPVVLPSFTIPRAGVYALRSAFYLTSGGGGWGMHTFGAYPAGATLSGSPDHQGGSPTNNWHFLHGLEARLTLAAGVVVGLRHTNPTGAGYDSLRRSLIVTPLRVT